jgi:hypothetical protein
MYKLFTDKTEIFECNIKLEGAALKNSQARLLIESSDLSLIFKGTINSDGKCQIPIKKLKGLLDENTQGNIKLEVIADDTYFTPWDTNFIVETSRKVTVEVKSAQETPIITESKPKISISDAPKSLASIKKDHTLTLLEMLVKENINLLNISSKKDRLNRIIENYVKTNHITLKEKDQIIVGLIEGLSKI